MATKKAATKKDTAPKVTGVSAAVNRAAAAYLKKVSESAPKKTAKKASATKKATKKVQGTHRDQDLPWCDKKVTLFKTLKALKAVGPTNAKGSKEIVEKSNDALSPRDVRHYSYHAKAAGLIDLADVEGVTGYSYFLTAKGAKVDPVAELKKQQAKK